MKKLLLSIIAALVASYGMALAISGNQLGFPIVGGASYCSSYTNNNCSNTVAAGPSVATGNETIIANTNLASGANPQTVLLQMATLNALPYSYVAAPVSGNTTTLTNLVGALILDPTTTIAAYGVTFPAATTLVDGQVLTISATNTITALNLTAGTGTSLSNTPTTIGATACTSGAGACGFGYRYVASVTKWFRLY